MKRRKFIISSLSLLGSGLIIPSRIFAVPSGSRPGISVVKGENPALITRKAVALIGGMQNFVSRGDVVIIKPNMAWDRTPLQAANTNPEVVAEAVSLSLKAGAAKVKVFDNTCNMPRRVYKRSGIAAAAKKAGAEVSFMDERKFTESGINGDALRQWPVCRDALEADKIINVPVAKHHSLTRLTMGIKNLMGLIGGRRNLLHQHIDTSIVDLAAFFKPTLTILDAFRILTANGPQGGNLKDVETLKTVVASSDPVAVDSIGASFFGLKAADLPYLLQAYERGLGEMNLDNMSVVREMP